MPTAPATPPSPAPKTRGTYGTPDVVLDPRYDVECPYEGGASFGPREALELPPAERPGAKRDRDAAAAEGEKQGAHDAFAALRYYYRMSRGLPQDEEPEG